MIISIVKNKSGKFNLEKPTVYSTSAGDKMMTVEISLIFSSDSWPMWFTDKSYRHLRGRSKSMLKKSPTFSHHTTSVQGLKKILLPRTYPPSVYGQWFITMATMWWKLHYNVTWGFHVIKWYKLAWNTGCWLLIESIFYFSWSSARWKWKIIEKNQDHYSHYFCFK